MKRRLPVGLLSAALLMFGSVAVSRADDERKGDFGDSRADDERKSDFAFFDGTSSDAATAGALCGAGSPSDVEVGEAYTFHIALANLGGPGFVRLTYADGDFIRFPIAANASLTLSQAAGGRGGFDRAVRVHNESSAAQLAGTMSAAGGGVFCLSCDTGADGDAACDAIIPDVP
jgi:hypothetical protein